MPKDTDPNDNFGHMSPELVAKVHEVQELLRAQHHPHTQIVVDSGTAVLWEGVHCVHNPALKPIPKAPDNPTGETCPEAHYLMLLEKELEKGSLPTKLYNSIKDTVGGS